MVFLGFGATRASTEIVNVTEPLIPGSIVEARIIGIMTFDDGGEAENVRIRASHFVGMLAAGESLSWTGALLPSPENDA